MAKAKPDQGIRSAGARLERRALRDAIRRELGTMQSREFHVNKSGLEWVMSWLSGRIERTRKLGGIGRK